MNRRQFVTGTTAFALTASGGALFYQYGDTLTQPLSTTEVIAEYARSLKGVERVGLAFLAHERSPRDRDNLARQIVLSFDAVDATMPVTVAEIKTHVAERIQRDFEEDLLCEVDGWQLSRTECRLAGLHATVNNITVAAAFVAPTIAAAKEEKFVEVSNWGPRKTAYNVPFNQQPNGRSGMWFTAKNPPRSIEVYINGKAVPTTVDETHFTITVYGARRDEMIRAPGTYSIDVYDKVRRVKQRIGGFIVSEKPEYATLADGSTSTVFCPIDHWGPKQTKLGSGFNLQPDGSSAFWIRINCAPQSTIMQLGDHNLETTVRSDLVTARLLDKSALLEEGTFTVKLFDPASGELLRAGDFSIKTP